MFEVQDLRYATLATVSRCGMVWFSEDVLSTEMIFENHLSRLRTVPVEEGEEETRRIRAPEGGDVLSPTLQVSAQAKARTRARGQARAKGDNIASGGRGGGQRVAVL